jgi:hypothetical protein
MIRLKWRLRQAERRRRAQTSRMFVGSRLCGGGRRATHDGGVNNGGVMVGVVKRIALWKHQEVTIYQKTA